jgi:hypothetical protein
MMATDNDKWVRHCTDCGLPTFNGERDPRGECLTCVDEAIRYLEDRLEVARRVFEREKKRCGTDPTAMLIAKRLVTDLSRRLEAELQEREE